MEIELKLPWPPSVNAYKKIGKLVKTKTGKLYQQRVNSDETRTFYYQVYMRVKQQMPLEWTETARNADISFEVYVEMSAPTQRRWDLDNRLKVLLDSLVRAHVILDDSQIYKLIVVKKDTVEGGAVVVRIKSYV